ncbi:SMI1/KNR4 family protein [Streptomyces smyrnaeus]|uniref:hypothetical protein n=1 Tax=Streptomyces smyrnaeus TaxID=1387713 RepID=UPI0036B1DEEE
MSLPPVAESWARIDTWLSQHAPLSHARLRPPAFEADIAAAQRALDVTFPADLVASLRCHDGVEPLDGAPVLAYNGPPSGLADIVKSTELLREVDADLADDAEEHCRAAPTSGPGERGGLSLSPAAGLRRRRSATPGAARGGRPTSA